MSSLLLDIEDKDVKLSLELRGLYPKVVDSLADHLHKEAVARGWWNEARNDGELIALMHSELSEALETLREPQKPSEHIPQFTGLEEELADAVIRIFDYAAARRVRLGAAIMAKADFNKTRALRHGKKF